MNYPKPAWPPDKGPPSSPDTVAPARSDGCSVTVSICWDHKGCHHNVPFCPSGLLACAPVAPASPLHHWPSAYFPNTRFQKCFLPKQLWPHRPRILKGHSDLMLCLHCRGNKVTLTFCLKLFMHQCLHFKFSFLLPHAWSISLWLSGGGKSRALFHPRVWPSASERPEDRTGFHSFVCSPHTHPGGNTRKVNPQLTSTLK